MGETVRAALNALSTVVPSWVKSHIPLDWYERYAQRMSEFRLPQQASARQAWAQTIGADGSWLLDLIYGEQAPSWLREVPAVEVLRQVWVQQSCWLEGRLRLRTEEDLPPAARLILSPYEPEARVSFKRSTRWLGDILHITETCEAEEGHLIVQVETTPSTTQDVELTDQIHQELASKQLLPREQLLDSGYIAATHLVKIAEEDGVELVGPVPPDPSWPARAEQGFGLAQFQLDWQAQVATCPQGKTSRTWTQVQEADRQDIIRISFAKVDCLACPSRSLCTAAKSEPPRLTVRPQAEHQALQAARDRQRTAQFKEQYAVRAGVEGTISQGVQVFGFRQARYVGQAKTHFQHLISAAALNVVRLLDWLQETPRCATRTSRFAALAP